MPTISIPESTSDQYPIRSIVMQLNRNVPCRNFLSRHDNIYDYLRTPDKGIFYELTGLCFICFRNLWCKFLEIKISKDPNLKFPSTLKEKRAAWWIERNELIEFGVCSWFLNPIDGRCLKSHVLLLREFLDSFRGDYQQKLVEFYW